MTVNARTYRPPWPDALEQRIRCCIGPLAACCAMLSSSWPAWRFSARRSAP